MPSKVFSAALVGLESFPIEVEVDLARGLHLFSIVGLPDKAVEESKERVSAAIKNSSLVPPNKTNQRVIVNLAPAHLKKEGPKYDLPIALSYLLASRQLFFDSRGKIFVGELALDGSIRPIRGTLPVALMAHEKGFREIFVPWENRKEAAAIGGIKAYGIKNLKEVVQHFTKEKRLKFTEKEGADSNTDQKEIDHDFAYIKGQENVKRALEIAAAGGHNILMSGPPGSGKTLLARALVSILPAMNWQETLEVTKIYSIVGLTNDKQALITKRPFRSPHHSASAAALVGGGSIPKPGEITLSHRGVLFLDEFPEFDRHVIESLRQPLEDGVVTVSRAQGTLAFPAKCMFVATMNPCPCGFLDDPSKHCACTPFQIARYRRKLSGPLLDRIDLHVAVPRVKYEKISSEEQAESTHIIRSRVQNARKRQQDRFANLGYYLNSEMQLRYIKQFCALDKECGKIIKQAMEYYGLSARAYHRILKLSRTIADLEEQDKILPSHLQEALQFRPQGEGEVALL